MSSSDRLLTPRAASQRRDFLKQLGAAALTMRLPVNTEQPASALHTSVIPVSGERVPRVGLGTWQGFDAGTNASRRAELQECLRTFLAGGGTVIDTSPMYGSSERVLGDLLAAEPLRDRAWLATKVWTTGAKAGVDQMEESLRLLRRERIPLMQIHNLVDWRTQWRTLRTWKDDGRIRYAGITHYQNTSIADVEQVLRAERVDTVQLNLSLDEPDAVRLLPLCQERGVAFIANRPFGGGGALGRVRGQPLPPWCAELGITSWAQYMLKWILSYEAVTVAIPGTGNARHVADNLAAARGPIPDAAMRTRMMTHWRSL